mgnify:FL=1
MRMVSMVAACAVLLTTSPLAFGQPSDEGETSGPYVPRSEYERLKQDFEALKAQVRQMQQQTSMTTATQGPQSVQGR